MYLKNKIQLIIIKTQAKSVFGKRLFSFFATTIKIRKPELQKKT